MNTELMEALEVLEKEKNISKDTLLEAIEQSLIQARPLIHISEAHET